jgi:hypothetical protein
MVSGKSFTSIQSWRCQESRHDRREPLRRLERHAAAIVQLPAAEKMIEAQSAHAEPIPLPQSSWRHIDVRHSDPAQAAGRVRKGIQHGGIVAPVRAPLHQDAARKADGIQHAQIFGERSIRRRITAVVGISKPVGWTEHVGVRVARPWRRRDFRARDLTRRQAGRSDRHHSALIPAAWMIGPHFS